MKYDLLIIGTGAAGLTAAIYGRGYNLKTAVFGELPGGTVGEADEIQNFPSYKLIKGFELAKRMMDHAKDSGAEIKFEKVLEIKKKSNEFIVITNKDNYLSKKVIIATGLDVKKLGLKKEKEFLGKGISYCATCDAGFYKDKIVGIVGGGDAALTSAMLLSKFAKKVYIIYRRNKFFRALPVYINKIKENKKITSIFNSNVKELLGNEKLTGVLLDTKKKIKLDGLFIIIGGSPNVNVAKNLELETDNGYIKVDKFQRTNIKGLFAAGDVTNNHLKQIITACAEGAIAADSAYNELERKQ